MTGEEGLVTEPPSVDWACWGNSPPPKGDAGSSSSTDRNWRGRRWEVSQDVRFMPLLLSLGCDESTIGVFAPVELFESSCWVGCGGGPPPNPSDGVDKSRMAMSDRSPALRLAIKRWRYLDSCAVGELGGEMCALWVGDDGAEGLPTSCGGDGGGGGASLILRRESWAVLDSSNLFAEGVGVDTEACVTQTQGGSDRVL